MSKYQNILFQTIKEVEHRKQIWVNFFSVLLILIGLFRPFDVQSSCCSGRPEFSYFLSPKPSQKFQYLIRYETFFSSQLGKEKGFFVVLPEDFFQNPSAQYPTLFLLHGYNFHRTGIWWKVHSPEKAMKILCEVKEEEYHWLFHEAIAVVAYAMMESQNQTYRELERSLEMRFQELSQYSGLGKGDLVPREIAQSIVSHNLHSQKNLNDLFRPIQKMIIVLPDGDNGFYTDENEGKKLFPMTKSRKGCDDFHLGEALNYSLIPFLYMKPGALGKYESYFLELIQYFETQSPYKGRMLPKRGIGGFSMGGLGALKLGLKYPHLFHSVSSQSGLLDLGLLQNKWLLKMIMPEFLEVFGRFQPSQFPFASSIEMGHLQANNPFALMKKNGINQLPHWFYFDYGAKEGSDWITEGNQNVERLLNEGSHQISVQPYNGGSGHNYQFWRSRSGNMLQHHSNVFQKIF